MIKVYVCDISKIKSEFIKNFDNIPLEQIGVYKCLYTIFDNFDVSQLKHDSLNAPFIINSVYHISISHKKNYAIVAVSENNVGVDIEYVKGVSEIFKRKMLTKKDLENVSNNTSFFKMWTIKEAIIKYTKLGNKLPINSFSVDDYLLFNQTIFLNGYCIAVTSKVQDDIELIEV